jgi:DNA invertase Pin-like site-specific DNA recombinase
MTSARTKAGLAAAKARSTRLGNPRLRPGASTTAAAYCLDEAAVKGASEVLPYIPG